jgi:TonB family protein
MYDVVANALNGRGREPEGLRRMIGISIGAHVVLTAAIVMMPAGWLSRQADPTSNAMFISLSAPPGAKSGGMTAISARPVQQAVPDLPKVQPVRPPAQKTPEMTAPDPTLKPKPAKPTTQVQEAPKEARGRTPTTGTQERGGKAMAETSSQQANAVGLTTGGGGTGGPTSLANFCCPDYVGEMVNRINQNWNPRQSTTGTTIMRFTIQRDGRITDISVAQSSGYQMMDYMAQRALLAVNPLPPLPQAYTNPTLVVNLNFEYQR